EDPRTYIQALEPLIQGTARRRVPGRQQKRRAVEGFGEITAIGLSQLGAAEKRHTALTEQMIKGFYIKRWAIGASVNTTSISCSASAGSSSSLVPSRQTIR